MTDSDFREVSVAFNVAISNPLSPELSINMCVHMPVFAQHDAWFGVIAQSIMLTYGPHGMERWIGSLCVCDECLL